MLIQISAPIFPTCRCVEIINGYIYAHNFQIIDALGKLPKQIQTVLEQDSKVSQIASNYFSCSSDCFNGQHKCKNSLLLMGRGYNYATCLEGALKLKELVNMHSEGNNLIILTAKYLYSLLY